MDTVYRSINYGGVGITMAHEMMHSLDENARMFYKNGLLTYWWSQASIDEYDVRARKISQQFSQYTISGNKVSDILYIYISCIHDIVFFLMKS